MAISFKHSERLELNRIEYSGALSTDELFAHARFRGEAKQWLNYDHINLILPGTDASHLARADLDDLFQRHQALFETQKLLILRRSAWVCQSAGALEMLRYWLGDRAAKPRAFTDVRLFETIDAACDWLLLQGDEKTLAVSGEGFDEVAHFIAPPLAA